MCSLKDKTVMAVNKALEGKGIWVADRGFDGLNSYETWFSLGCNFVVRQRGDRHVVSSNGIQGKIKGSDTFSLTFMLPYSVLLLLLINIPSLSA
jgi:hypothetical protein